MQGIIGHVAGPTWLDQTSYIGVIHNDQPLIQRAAKADQMQYRSKD